MKHHKIHFFLLLQLFLFSSAYALSPQMGVADLCAQDTEGSFTGKMDGKGSIRVNLFCADSGRMLGTLAEIDPQDFKSFFVNLGSAEIDGNDLVVAPFSKDPKNHREKSSANTFNYLRLDLKAFLDHRLDGYFVGFRGEAFHKLVGNRTQVFPKQVSKLSRPLEFKPRGLFQITGLPGADRLLFDVLHGVPIATLDIGGNTPVHLTNGVEWNASGVFHLNNVGGDCGESHSQILFDMRGSFLSADEMELYLISPKEGLSHPLRAKMISEAPLK